MRDTLQSYMKVGIVHFAAFPEASAGTPLVTSIRKIAEDEFFGSVEIQPVPADVREEVARILRASGLVIGYCAQPVLLAEKLNLNSPDEPQRQAAVSRVKSILDEAYHMGARKLAVLSGPMPAPESATQAKKLLVDSLSQICQYAEGKGNISIALEVFDRDIDKKCLIGPTTEAVQVATEVRRKCANFGLMQDLSHLPLLRESPAYALKESKDYLIHAHVGNCLLADKSHPAYGDKHPPFGIDGGENDVDELHLFLKALLDIGYIGDGKQNVVAFEVRPPPGDSPEAVIAHCKRTLIEAWSKV